MVQRGDTEVIARGAESPCNRLSESIIGAAIEVHKHVGPGLLESAYEMCLSHELGLRGIPYRRQVPVEVEYKGLAVAKGYRIDLLVGEMVVVELKAIESINDIHHVQLLTHLRLSRLPLGLIINFNVPVLWKGVRRVVNNL